MPLWSTNSIWTTFILSNSSYECNAMFVFIIYISVLLIQFWMLNCNVSCSELPNGDEVFTSNCVLQQIPIRRRSFSISGRLWRHFLVQIEIPSNSCLDICSGQLLQCMFEHRGRILHNLVWCNMSVPAVW